MTKKRINGVDVEALGQIVSALQADPSLADFEFRSSTEWQSGAVVRSTFSGHKQNGVNAPREQPHELGGDEPVALLGTAKHVGPARPMSAKSASIPAGHRPPKCAERIPTYQPMYRVDIRAIHLVSVPSIWAPPCIASTVPTHLGRSARPSPRAASACTIKMCLIFIRASVSAHA